ncbi:uncharacterized protein LOC123294812 [Chrysoperla carnea]|uniref:uncharacterized protein LOC123294812 n=1 Tax=Chrysoperla carnea TaxID=189513 RepID=UPI001D06E7A3|nr:uncharacterized protein LOC123294812 [Chrysoperla carnea]XP_044731904.1 uncharacterized protein LOC123294812 [Chrysoperla carnea]
MQLKSCCGCYSTKVGTIITGALGIILSILTIIIILTTDFRYRTIIIDTLPTWIVKIILTINLIMTIILCALLILGAKKRNMYYMLPWVVLGLVLAIGLLVSVIYTSVVFFLDGDNFNGVFSLVFGIIFFCVYVYLWLVVFSFFQIVREEYARGVYKQPFLRYPPKV